MTTSPKVQGLRVDERGFWFRTSDDDVVDVKIDGRRIWSFWLLRDTAPEAGGRFVEWPGALRPYLDGVTRLSIVAHVSDTTLFDEELSLGTGTERIAVVNANGAPLGLDKTNKLMLTFDTRSAEHVAPLLDSVEAVVVALKEAGIEAFLAYGSLLGAVRAGKLIGHDSDADLGYVSSYTKPVDVIRESFRVQRRITELGFPTYRYSGLAFRIDVRESDGSKRGLDVFGGFIAEAYGDHPATLYLMGEVGAPFEREWIYPLGETTLEGRTFPAPAVPEKLLEAMYGPSWRVPDPAYHFTTPRATVRRLNGWFRGIRLMRNEWERRYSKLRNTLPPEGPSPLAAHVVDAEGGVPELVVDLGPGRAGDALWFARQGARVRALDFVVQASLAVQDVAAAEGLELSVENVNLNSLRSSISAGIRLANTPGRKVIVARHLIDAQSNAARRETWRVCRMALRGGSGRLYLEFIRGDPRPRVEGAAATLLSPLRVADVVAELEEQGAVIVHQEMTQEIKASGEPGRPVARLVAEWQS
ncbi:MAG: hypothetical protein ACJ72E_03905 [Marmoricola sp.]